MDKIYIYIKKPIYLPWLSLSNDTITLGKGTIISKQKFINNFLDDELEYELIQTKFKDYFIEFPKTELDKYLKINKKLFF
ncbi:MAG: hypothetical protein IJP83_02555 [Mycoplasma sp.]|nr:hypothetical protein [Mycoplasma sp.]